MNQHHRARGRLRSICRWYCKCFFVCFGNELSLFCYYENSLHASYERITPAVNTSCLHFHPLPQAPTPGSLISRACLSKPPKQLRRAQALLAVVHAGHVGHGNPNPSSIPVPIAIECVGDVCWPAGMGKAGGNTTSPGSHLVWVDEDALAVELAGLLVARVVGSIDTWPSGEVRKGVAAVALVLVLVLGDNVYGRSSQWSKGMVCQTSRSRCARSIDGL